MTTGRRLRVRLVRGLSMTMCSIVLSFAYSPGTAQPAADPVWGLEQLMQRLGQVKNVHGKFVERKHLRILNAPLEFSGTLVYKAPGHLEKHTLLPKPQSLILDQDRLTVEDKAKQQRRTLMLQDYPVVWAFVESIRSTLAGDLQALNRFYKVELEGSENQWRLLLTPSDPAIKFLVSQIRISGARHSIRAVEIVEAEGDRSVMTIIENMQ